MLGLGPITAARLKALEAEADASAGEFDAYVEKQGLLQALTWCTKEVMRKQHLLHMVRDLRRADEAKTPLAHVLKIFEQQLDAWTPSNSSGDAHRISANQKFLALREIAHLLRDGKAELAAAAQDG